MDRNEIFIFERGRFVKDRMNKAEEDDNDDITKGNKNYLNFIEIVSVNSYTI